MSEEKEDTYPRPARKKPATHHKIFQNAIAGVLKQSKPAERSEGCSKLSDESCTASCDSSSNKLENGSKKSSAETSRISAKNNKIEKDLPSSNSNCQNSHSDRSSRTSSSLNKLKCENKKHTLCSEETSSNVKRNEPKIKDNVPSKNSNSREHFYHDDRLENHYYNGKVFFRTNQRCSEKRQSVHKYYKNTSTQNHPVDCSHSNHVSTKNDHLYINQSSQDRSIRDRDKCSQRGRREFEVPSKQRRGRDSNFWDKEKSAYPYTSSNSDDWSSMVSGESNNSETIGELRNLENHHKLISVEDDHLLEANFSLSLDKYEDFKVTTRFSGFTPIERSIEAPCGNLGQFSSINRCSANFTNQVTEQVSARNYSTYEDSFIASPEQIVAVSEYLLEIEKKQTANCDKAVKVRNDLNRQIQYNSEGNQVNLYGSYSTGLAITTSNMNFCLTSSASMRSSAMYQMHKILSKDLYDYHFQQFESESDVKKVKICFTEPYTDVDCELVYLGRRKGERFLEMDSLLKILSGHDKRVKCLFIASKIWAEHCGIDVVEEGKLPSVAFPLMVTHFLQRCEMPILPVFSGNSTENLASKLKQCPKSNSSVGELWLAFMKYFAVTFNWEENAVSVTDLSKVSKDQEKAWIVIQDPFSQENIAKSVTNLDSANFIKACFKAFYEYLPSPEASSYDSKDCDLTNLKKMKYSFGACDIYQYAPSDCEDCDDQGTCEHCKKKELQISIKPLPDISGNSEFLCKINKVLRQVYDEYSLSESAVKGRKAFVADMEKDLQKRFKGAKLTLFGSSVNGFGFKKSDLDISMSLYNDRHLEHYETISILRNVCKYMRQTRQYKSVLVLPAQIPIIKFFARYGDFRGDISLGNPLAVYNSELLRSYSIIDERCKILCCALKLLTKKAHIVSTANKFLSSYSYILMVIHYLQQVKPPVLPVLQDHTLIMDLSVPDERVEEWNVWFFKDYKQYSKIISDLGGPNNMSVEELWIGLLDFYVKFDYNNVISIRQVEALPAIEKQRTFEFYNIEDPFILSKNLCSVLTHRTVQEIQNVFCRARELFGDPKKSPNYIDNLKDHFFSTQNLTGRIQREMVCHKCGEFDHENDQCIENVTKNLKFNFNPYRRKN